MVRVKSILSGICVPVLLSACGGTDPVFVGFTNQQAGLVSAVASAPKTPQAEIKVTGSANYAGYATVRELRSSSNNGTTTQTVSYAVVGQADFSYDFDGKAFSGNISNIHEVDLSSGDIRDLTTVQTVKINGAIVFDPVQRTAVGSITKANGEKAQLNMNMSAPKFTGANSKYLSANGFGDSTATGRATANAEMDIVGELK